MGSDTTANGKSASMGIEACRVERQVGNLFIPRKRMPRPGSGRITLIQDKDVCLIRRWKWLDPKEAVLSVLGCALVGAVMIGGSTGIWLNGGMPYLTYVVVIAIISVFLMILASTFLAIVGIQMYRGVHAGNTLFRVDHDSVFIHGEYVPVESVKSLRVAHDFGRRKAIGETQYFTLGQLSVRLPQNSATGAAIELDDWVILHTGSTRRISRIAEAISRRMHIPVEYAKGDRSTRLDADDLEELLQYQLVPDWNKPKQRQS